MKILAMLMTGMVIFFASAAGAWYAKSSLLQSTPSPSEIDGPLTLPSSSEQSTSSAGDDLMPVAVREGTMSVEELLRFSLELKERQRQLEQAEGEFQERQIQQQLVLADIRAEQQTVDGLRLQLRQRLDNVEGMIAELTQIRETLLKDREESKQELDQIDSQRIEVEEQHAINNKKLSQWLQGMEPTKAAGVLKEMANDGKMDVAVQLLANFEEREAAKILDEVEDTKLLNSFIEAFRNLKNDKK